MSARWNGVISAFAGAGLLVLVLAAIDPRVRDAVAALTSGRAPVGELATFSAQVEGVAVTILGAVRDQSIEHAALTIFALGALVLLLFMTRT
jgi:regulator of RNase E activity RraA